jgi:hypothetical protein
VTNPFYNYLTPEVVPGPLRNQQRVTIGSLLRPYPQYGGMFEIATPSRLERYHSLQLKAQRAFRGGYNFIFGYSYIREKSYDLYDDLATYSRTFTFLESADPRHRISAAGTYQLPFGKGRKYFSAAHRVVDGVLGGWQVVGVVLRPAIICAGGMRSGNPVLPSDAATVRHHPRSFRLHAAHEPQAVS